MLASPQILIGPLMQASEPIEKEDPKMSSFRDKFDPKLAALRTESASPPLIGPVTVSPVPKLAELPADIRLFMNTQDKIETLFPKVTSSLTVNDRPSSSDPPMLVQSSTIAPPVMKRSRPANIDSAIDISADPVRLPAIETEEETSAVPTTEWSDPKRTISTTDRLPPAVMPSTTESLLAAQNLAPALNCAEILISSRTEVAPTLSQRPEMDTLGPSLVESAVENTDLISTAFPTERKP